MRALPPDLRKKLEDTIIEARDVAEAGARAALEALAVHHHEHYPHQKPEHRKLRIHLRARARQLGDTQNSRGELAMAHLVHECAYEHWHRMLFARFLAENELLIEPDSQVAISLAEAEELAKESKIDMWTFASRCAQQMLPQIFRPDDPLLQIGMASEHRVKLERLLEKLDPATFKADDSLGWVYQFWQSKKKDEVNDSGEKITGGTLPAVTQLFTEHYMVLFLLHNTVGAWHACRVLAADPELAESAAGEDALRKAVAIQAGGGYSFDYLRFVRGADGKSGPWRPAAGAYEGWPKTAAGLKVLDPCCGSGHFLVAAFYLLVCLRMAEEGLDLPRAIDAVLRDNLFGLELDARCTQIAAFNLALAAWKLAGYRQLPALHLACSGIGPRSMEPEWLDLLEKGPALPLREMDRVRNGMRELHRLFSLAPTLGSLIDPSRLPSDFLSAGFESIRPYLADALSAEAEDEAVHERTVAAAGMVEAASILAGKYTLVITNVPYLGRGKQDEILKAHLEAHYKEGKADLATAFVLRAMDLCAPNGTTALVTPQNWLFLTTYTKLRESLLKDRTWNMVARLGPGAFETIGGHVVNVALISISEKTPDAAHAMVGFDVSASQQTAEKSAMLRCNLKAEIAMLTQAEQLKNPDARISVDAPIDQTLLGEYAICRLGLGTGDAPHYLRNFWEFAGQKSPWQFYQNTTEKDAGYNGFDGVVVWDSQRQRVLGMTEPERKQAHNQDYRGREVWGRRGISVSIMSTLNSCLYEGALFDKLVAVIVAKNDQHLSAIAAFVKSEAFNAYVRRLDQKLMVTNATLVKVPFDLAHWQKVAAEKYPNGLPEPESDDPTQWLFHGRPEASTVPLQVAVARLMGYRWPAELDPKMRLSQRARELVARCESLLEFMDDDGIVCIPSVRGEEPAADRLFALLAGCGLKPDRDLDDWLRNDFFREHCDLFHQRPFIWHIWDGRRRDGFHALVNYHKLASPKSGTKLLENLTYSYLGDWINRQKDGVKRGEDGAEECLAAALEFQKRLVAILEGEPPFGLFVRWKPLHEQPIGWEPDLNDGVRLNIRPFLADDLPGGRSGAGVLRWKPSIKWDKDRGKEPVRPKSDFPWFWNWDGKSVDFRGGSEFDGNRWNGCHYTVAAKRRAREEKAAEGKR